MVCLARDIGYRMDVASLGENSEWVQIGHEIPPLAVSTIELTHTAESRSFHQEAFLRIITLAGLKTNKGGGAQPSGGATVANLQTLITIRGVGKRLIARQKLLSLTTVSRPVLRRDKQLCKAISTQKSCNDK